MQLYGVLVLVVTLSAACGLRCYTCFATTNPDSCTETFICPPGLDRCSTTDIGGAVVKNCFVSTACGGPINCCKGDLCNGALPTGSSVLLLLVSSAITTLFL